MTSIDSNEVSKLRKELKSLQDLFRQLTEEDKSETYDVRRTKMLKGQIIQLERQCMLLSDALSSRSSIMIEMENELIALIEEFQEALALEKPGPTVTISRKDLINHIHSMQKLKRSMQKLSSLSSPENLKIPQLSGMRFCKSTDISCVQACSGKIDHINLQHVAYLESNLVGLFKSLSALQALLQSIFPKPRPTSGERAIKTEGNGTSIPEAYLLSHGFEKIATSISTCNEQLEDCCLDLLSLSLLHPSTPWSVTKTPNKFGLFEPSRIINSLPANLQRYKEMKTAVTSMCKAHSYLMHVYDLKLQAVNEEVNFCNQISTTYAHYMNCLIEGVMKAYQDCELGLSKLIREPISEILDSWNILKEDQSENTMRQLMNSLKKNEDALARLVEKMSLTAEHGQPNDFETGLKILEEFRTDLKRKIESLKSQSAKMSSKQYMERQAYVHRTEPGVIERLRTILDQR